jgi:hypothetical protein
MDWFGRIGEVLGVNTHETESPPPVTDPQHREALTSEARRLRESAELVRARIEVMRATVEANARD